MSTKKTTTNTNTKAGRACTCLALLKDKIMSTKKTTTNTNTKAESAPATKPAENKVEKKVTEKVIFKKMYRGMRGCFDPGQVAEVPADFAAAMIAAGLAEKC